MQFLAIGLDHTTADLTTRERLASTLVAGMFGLFFVLLKTTLH